MKEVAEEQLKEQQICGVMATRHGNLKSKKKRILDVILKQVGTELQCVYFPMSLVLLRILQIFLIKSF
ncbi:hypothetical protein D3C77_675580 [compost metagenome]